MKQSRTLAVSANFRAFLPRLLRFELWRHGRGHHLQRGRDVSALDQPFAHPAIAVARECIQKAPLLRIDPDERLIDVKPTGVWVRAWIWVDRAAIESREISRRARFRDAVAALPEPARSVFLAHSVEDLSYELIAERHNLTIAAVQRAIAQSLVMISTALDEG